jgi:hypothetical protein
MMLYGHSRHVLVEENFDPCLWAEFQQLRRKKNSIEFKFLSTKCPLLG